MSGKDAIIDRILSDAKAQSEKIINDAQDRAKVIISKAKAYTDKYSKDEIGRAEALFEDIERRKVTVANLEAKKILLFAKQKVINQTFEDSLDRIISLKKADYLKIIKGMLLAYAQDKDVVIISQRDKGVITKTFINNVAKEMGIKLALSDSYGDFKGGIVLSSDDYDKNISLEVQLSILRDELEPKIADMIFGDVK